MRRVKQLITLALACLLAVPAFAMPMVGGNGRGDMFGQLDLTEEEMADMTLAELREMAEEAETEASDRPLFMGEIGLLITDLTVEDLEGMTLAELNEHREVLNLLGLGGPHNNQFGMGGPNDFQGTQVNNFGMAGTCIQQQQGMGMGCMNGLALTPRDP